MTIQYCSDLHLEFKDNSLWLQQNPIEAVGEVLLLAGDVVPFSEMDGYTRFFDFLSKSFELVLWVPGNHEYYYADAAQRSGSFTEKIRENVWLVNNTVVKHHNVRFVCTTLWSQISPANAWQVQRSMSDFRVIRYHGHTFNVDDFNQLHSTARNFVEAALSEPTEMDTVVLTHHIPTMMHYPEQYKGDALNEAFAVELYGLIEASTAKYWIYGHHHSNVPDFVIGNTQMLTNQLGYVKYGEHGRFDGRKVFVVG